MNLKDAFRAQNKLQALMDEAGEILQNQGNTLKVTTTHLRSKIMPEAQDAVTEEAAPSEYAEHINQVAVFLMAMLVEREKLSAAICAAKSKLRLDSAKCCIEWNRQTLFSTFPASTFLPPFPIRELKNRPYASPFCDLAFGPLYNKSPAPGGDGAHWSVVRSGHGG